MEYSILVIGGAFLLVGLYLAFGQKKDKGGVAKELEQLASIREADRAALSLMQQQLGELTRQIDARLSESRRDVSEAVHRQFGESQKLLSDINTQMSDRLIAVAREQSKANEAVQHFVQIGDQLANLERVLTHQKQRGNWGEASLTLILENILPPDAYRLQYAVTDREVVDAAIIAKEGIIPVDAKFSLDNYLRLAREENVEKKEEYEKEFQKDLKKRIDETAKYINTKEGTLPFAFMFIPAEAIYYDLLVNDVGNMKSNSRSLIDYAYTEKHVIIVSPTTFAAYLHLVLHGLQAYKIEKAAEDIRRQISEFVKHFEVYSEYYEKLGTSLKTTVNHFNTGTRELGKIGKDIRRITSIDPTISIETVELPSIDEE